MDPKTYAQRLHHHDWSAPYADSLQTVRAAAERLKVLESVATQSPLHRKVWEGLMPYHQICQTFGAYGPASPQDCKKRRAAALAAVAVWLEVHSAEAEPADYVLPLDATNAMGRPDGGRILWPKLMQITAEPDFYAQRRSRLK